ncbi:MAG: helix-turn-helix transcriptional regulator [Gemmatimonadota bacterium]
MRRYSVAEPRSVPPFPRGLTRRKPRDFFEWRTLRAWEKLPEWEEVPPGYLLRETREKAQLTQRELAARLGTTQQAVSQAEKWDANPTVALMRRWADACGAVLEIEIERI